MHRPYLVSMSTGKKSSHVVWILVTFSCLLETALAVFPKVFSACRQPVVEAIETNNSEACAEPFFSFTQEHADIVRLLLAQPRIDVGKGRTVDGATALTMASCTGNLGIVRALLNNSQTDVNQGARNYSLPFPNWPYLGLA